MPEVSPVTVPVCTALLMPIAEVPWAAAVHGLPLLTHLTLYVSAGTSAGDPSVQVAVHDVALTVPPTFVAAFGAVPGTIDTAGEEHTGLPMPLFPMT